MKRQFTTILILLMLTGCAGLNRSCTAFQAESFASDWIVVQYAADGHPINCWKLRNTSITNEAHSDGIYWLDPNSNHLVHISGWYNRVQVKNGDFEQAAKLIGVDTNSCVDGKYVEKK